MKRLFVGIPLPGPIKQHIEKMHKPLAGVRWVPSQQVHITLCFLGETPEKIIGRLKMMLTDINHPPFTLRTSELGAFPNLEHPRVLWIGIDKSHPLQQLRQQVKQACQKNDIDIDGKPFVPHITVCRVKDASADGVQSVENQAIGNEKWKVDQFNLYASHLTQQGAQYEILREYFLEA